MILIFRSRRDPEAPSMSGIFIGYMQFIWLCIVSFYFSSTIGGSLLRTMTFVVAFVSTVAASRALSIWWCRWMERETDMTIIEYDSASLDQKSLRDSAIIRRLIITAFPGRIVEFVSHDPTIGVPLQVLGSCIVSVVVLVLVSAPVYPTVGFSWAQVAFSGVIGLAVFWYSIVSSRDLFGRGGYYLV